MANPADAPKARAADLRRELPYHNNHPRYRITTTALVRNSMDWSSAINNPFLKDLPFKIELDKWGKVLMSPANNNHGSLQFETGAKIRDAKKGKGKVITECSINTSQGVKVADVAWASDSFIAQFGFETPYRRAPEICVEVVSPSNSQDEINEKIELYLAKGAHEVWIVSEDGQTKFYTYEGEIANSNEICS